MRRQIASPAASYEEVKIGWIYFLVQSLALKPVLNFIGSAASLNSTELNFIGFLLNFVAYSWIFRSFLWNSMVFAGKRITAVLFYAAVGVCGYEFWTNIISAGILYFMPHFSNTNTDYLVSLAGNGRFLIVVSLVILAPLAEECVFREMIFRQLFEKNKLLAYLISSVIFALGHILGYLGSASPMMLLLTFLQYLPSGVFLCWSYHQSGSFLTPLLMHIIINARSAQMYF